MLITPPKFSVSNLAFLLAVGVFIIGNLEPSFNPDPPAPRPAGQLGSYPGITGNVGFVFHFYGGIGYVASGFFQFVPFIRRTWPKLHRILGRTFFFFQLITMIGNMIFLYGSTRYLKGGLTSFLAVTIFFNPIWVFCSFKSVTAAYRGDIHEHHMWIIRTVALSVGNFLVPPIDSFIRMALDSYDGRESYATAFWFSFLLAFAGGEIFLSLAYPTDKSSNYVKALQNARGFYRDLVAWTQVKLVEKENLGTYFRLVFEAPHNVHVPPAHHLTFKDPKSSLVLPLFRPYTPVGQEKNRIEFLVKRYVNGPMSRYLTDLNVGDSTECCGPFGTFRLVPDHPKISIIAAGTGLTPMISILKHGLEHSETHFELTFFNSTMLLGPVLEQLKTEYPEKFSYTWVQAKQDFDMSKLFAAKGGSVKRATSLDGSHADILICGPRKFMELVMKTGMKNGIPESRMYAFGFSDR